MLPKATVSVILVAGGVGTRMKSTTPKQFLKINDKTIAMYSFELFLQMPEVKEIVVVCDPLYRPLFPQQAAKPVHFALPGSRRQDSVFNGLQALSQKNDFVCIHDSARPAIDIPLIRRVIEGAAECGAATAGMPVKFTVKEQNAEGFVKQTLDRSRIWEIQTPQVIRRENLVKGFEHLDEKKIDVTDDVSIIELLNLPVKLVQGSYANMKVTTPEDLPLIERLLEHGQRAAV